MFNESDKNMALNMLEDIDLAIAKLDPKNKADAKTIKVLKDKKDFMQKMVDANSAGIGHATVNQMDELSKAFLAGEQGVNYPFKARNAVQTTSRITSEEILNVPTVDWFDRALAIDELLPAISSTTLNYRWARENASQQVDASKAIGEGNSYATSNAGTEFQDDNLRKIGVMMTMTLEHMRDANRSYATSYVRERIEYNLRKKVDEFIFSGNGADVSGNTNPKGLARQSATPADFITAATANQIAATGSGRNLDRVLQDAMEKVSEVSAAMALSSGVGERGTYVLVNPTTLEAMGRVKDTDRRYLFDNVRALPTVQSNNNIGIFGVTPVESELISSGDLWVLALPQIQKWTFGGGGYEMEQGLNEDDFSKDQISRKIRTWRQISKPRGDGAVTRVSILGTNFTRAT